MADVFTTSGENSDNVVVPRPILQGLLIPGIDDALAVDGLGIVTPWGGGSTTRKYTPYGISGDVSIQNTQLKDLASSFLPAEGKGFGTTFNIEGLVGPQGNPGKDGTILIIHQWEGVNSNYLTALPHNLDLINDLGTAADKLIYTDVLNSYGGSTNWVERQPAGASNLDWQSVAADSDGSNLIACVENGRLYTSADYGVTWTERQPAGAANKVWVAVASDADGSHLIAAIKDGRIYKSINYGVTWTETRPAGDANKGWSSVASDSDGSNLIACVLNGRLYTSSDYGVNWTERQPDDADDNYWTTVASDDDGSVLIAGKGNTATAALYISVNSGVNWSEEIPAAATTSWFGAASDADGSNLMAGGNTGRIAISDDSGSTWILKGAGGGDSWQCTSTNSDGSYVIVGSGTNLYESFDSGVTFAETKPAGATTKSWKTVSTALDGSFTIVAVRGGRLYTGTVSVGYSEATWAESDLTSAGRAILDDATADDQRTTLGVGTGDSPEFVTTDLSGITDGNLPFMDTGGFADSPLSTDGTDIAASGIIQATGFARTGWPNTTGVTLSFDDGTRTLTVTDGGSAYYYINGIKYTLGGNKTVVIDATEGEWFIYFVGSTLTASQTPWVWKDADKAPVATIYWDNTNSKEILLGYELHGFTMDADTHSRLHDGGGAAWESGLLVSDAGSEQLNISAGAFHDEDNDIDISDGAGAGLFEQVLSPAELPIYYRSGASAWRIYETTDKANATDVGYVDGSNDLHYNKLNGTWASTATTTGKHVAYYVVATNDQTEPVALIMGQRVDNTLAASKSNNVFSGLSLSGLPFQEMVILARVIVKDTGSGVYYTIEDIQDLRATNAQGNVTSPLITDHGGLSGLGDDDHAQYIKNVEFTQNSGILVGTGAGTFQEETGATLRTSLGLGTGDAVEFSGVTTSYVDASDDISIRSGKALVLLNDANNRSINLQAPGALATSQVYTLPLLDGAAGEGIITDGNGILSFASVGSTFVGLSDTPANYVGGAKEICVVNAAGNAIEFRNEILVYDTGQVLINDVLYINEQAAADADIAGRGQVWVKNTSPNELWFTDDDGTDLQVAGGGGMNFVDRGDPASADWDETGSKAVLNTDANFHDLDCSAIVPAGAVSINFRLDVKDDAVGSIFILKKKGNTNSFNSFLAWTQVANQAHALFGILPCDTNRKCEYWATNTAWSQIRIVICGWFIPA